MKYSDIKKDMEKENGKDLKYSTNTRVSIKAGDYLFTLVHPAKPFEVGGNTIDAVTVALANRTETNKTLTEVPADMDFPYVVDVASASVGFIGTTREAKEQNEGKLFHVHLEIKDPDSVEYETARQENRAPRKKKIWSLIEEK